MLIKVLIFILVIASWLGDYFFDIGLHFLHISLILSFVFFAFTNKKEKEKATSFLTTKTKIILTVVMLLSIIAFNIIRIPIDFNFSVLIALVLWSIFYWGVFETQKK